MTTLLRLDGHAGLHGADLLLRDDPALWSGLAVFETLRTYGRVPFRLGTHLARLRDSARFCGIPWHPEVEPELHDLAAAMPGESRLNVLLTAGGRRLVRAEPLDLGRAGAPVRVASRAWSPDPWLPGWVKHTSRAAWVQAARIAGVDEVVWIAPEGVWTEANRSNLVVVRDGMLCTPPEDGRILAGVTRACMLEAARAAGVPVSEAPVPIGPCDEMYLCSTLKELAPVVELDGAPGPGGGPVGARVLAAFRAHAWG